MYYTIIPEMQLYLPLVMAISLQSLRVVNYSAVLQKAVCAVEVLHHRKHGNTAVQRWWDPDKGTVEKSKRWSGLACEERS